MGLVTCVVVHELVEFTSDSSKLLTDELWTPLSLDVLINCFKIHLRVAPPPSHLKDRSY